MASEFCLSNGFINVIKKRTSSRIHGNPYGVRVAPEIVSDYVAAE